MRQELANWKLTVDKDKGGRAAKGNTKVLTRERETSTSYNLLLLFYSAPDVLLLFVYFVTCGNDVHFTAQKKKGSKSGKKKKKDKDLTADR